MHEEELLGHALRRFGKQYQWTYKKILSQNQGQKVLDNIGQILDNQLSVLVYNFVDMLSHARTEMDMIKELARDEAAYRSLTISWFEHSNLFEVLKTASDRGVKVIITTDHGSVKINNPVKVIGDRKTTTNLRYKHGRNLNYNPKEVYEVKKPKDVFLPTPHISSKYIFAKEQDFLAYPNNYNHYVKYYKDTFQHGGISMEELLIPFAVLKPKG
jgi:phosphatidylserine/phosphatidylglycerophosphate/cardiolipin synthase-like enzyme